MIRPKKQHYVTKAYLEGFLQPGEGQLFCLMRHRAKSFRARPDEIAFEKNYYSFKMPDGTWNDGAEKFFADKIENPGLPVLKKLAEGRTRLNLFERNNLALLLAVQEFRVPFHRREFSRLSLELSKNIVQAYDAITDRRHLTGYFTLQTGPEPVRVAIDTLRNELDASSDVNQKKMMAILFRTACSLAEIYRHMKWTVYYATDDLAFATSDCPVISTFQQPKGFAALMRADVEVRFPLSRKAMLTLTHDMPFLEQIAHATKREGICLAGQPSFKI